MKKRPTNLWKVALLAHLFIYIPLFFLTKFFLNLQVIRGLDQGIFGGDGVPPMAVGMTSSAFSSAAGS